MGILKYFYSILPGDHWSENIVSYILEYFTLKVSKQQTMFYQKQIL